MEVHTDFLNHEFTEFKVHIAWVSSFHGQLLSKRIFWDYGQPLLLIGLEVTYPPEVFHCVVHSDTSEWNSVEHILTKLHISLGHLFH